MVVTVQPGSDRVTVNQESVPAASDESRTLQTPLFDSPVDVGGPFRAAWTMALATDRATPPDLASFLPDSDAARRGWLMQLISIDLQERWLRARLPKRLPEYCTEFDLDRASLPPGLIYEEFCIRRQGGDAVSPREYVAAYPHQASELTELLNTTSGEPTDTHDARAVPDATQAAAATATAAAGSFTADLSWTHPRTRDELEDLDDGDRLDDFDLLMGLGRGAFARVFLARQRSMQRVVAVKISEDRGSEPQTLAQLDHDYIVRVFDQRILPEKKLRLLYMQYLPGGTLLDVLHRTKKIPPSERSGQTLLDAIDAAIEMKGGLRPTDSTVRQYLSTLTWPETVAWIGRRLAEALNYAGDRGVLHRDIKPANVLLTAEGVPKLADFNISFSDNVKGDSPVAYFGGSLSYMSPEQLEACHPGLPGRAEDLDTRSDLYSLGVVLWELLTGVKPFDDTDVGSTAGDRTTIDGLLGMRLAGVADDALSSLPPHCPTTLRRVLLRCLAANRDDRWPTGRELAQQFDLCLDAHARGLVDPPPSSARFRVRPFTVPVMTAAIGIPNVIAAVYNYQHNKALIISDLSEVAQDRFEAVSTVINGIAWPLGLVMIVYCGRRIISVPHVLRAGRAVSEERLARTRADTLLVADRVVAVCLGLWIVAAVAYPVSLQIAAGAVPTKAYVHFFASLGVCGAMATAYPFFLVSLFTIRCLYPSLLPYGHADSEDVRRLHALDRRSVVYLAVAASIPLVAVAGLTFVPAEDIPDIIGVVRVMCVGGIAAFVVSYSIFRLLESDLRALRRAVSMDS